MSRINYLYKTIIYSNNLHYQGDIMLNIRHGSGILYIKNIPELGLPISINCNWLNNCPVGDMLQLHLDNYYYNLQYRFCDETMTFYIPGKAFIKLLIPMKMSEPIHVENMTYIVSLKDDNKQLQYMYEGFINYNCSPHGEGILFSDKGLIVSIHGKFNNGNIDTKTCTIYYKHNDHVYNGSIDNKFKRHGYGKLCYSGDKNILTLESDWNNDLPSGTSKIIYSDDSIYTGTIVYMDNKPLPNGTGKISFSDNSEYLELYPNFGHNTFENTLNYKNGNKFTGNIDLEYNKCPIFSGKGLFSYSDKNEIYESVESEWKIDKPIGKSNIKFRNGNFYSGEIKWENNEPIMNGKGIFESPTESYEGNYQNNIKNGYGITTFKVNSVKYTGNYVTGSMSGYGELYTFLKDLKNKFIPSFPILIKSIWKNNKPFSETTYQVNNLLFTGDLVNNSGKCYEGYCKSVIDPHNNKKIYEGNILNFQYHGWGTIFTEDPLLGKMELYSENKMGIPNYSNIKITTNKLTFEGVINDSDTFTGYGEIIYSESGEKYYGPIEHLSPISLVTSKKLNNNITEIIHPELGCLSVTNTDDGRSIIEINDMIFKGLITKMDKNLHCVGEMTYSNGTSYIGSLLDFKKHGYGSLNDFNKKIGNYIITTEWVNDETPNPVIIKHLNITFEGIIKNIKILSCYGKIIYPDNTFYFGKSKYLEKHGFGTYFGKGMKMTCRQWKKDNANMDCIKHDFNTDVYYVSYYDNGVWVSNGWSAIYAGLMRV